MGCPDLSCSGVPCRDAVQTDRRRIGIPHGKLVSLIEPTYADGVGNGMDANLFGGGCKHFDIEGFIKVVDAQDWKNRAKVQLWIMGADEGVGEASFSLIKLRRRRPSCPKAAKLALPSQPRSRSKDKRLPVRHDRDSQPAAASAIVRRRG